MSFLYWELIRDLVNMKDEQNLEIKEILDVNELGEKIKNLKGFLKRYYEMLPDDCWMSEETQAKKLKVGRSKVRTAKNKLLQEGLLELETLPNGKRVNLKHILHKSYPIKLRERRGDSYVYTLEDADFSADFYYSAEINWNFLQRFTAEEINQMEKLDKIRLYMDCGFIVLPTHYPIFDASGEVRCSCKRAFFCAHKGKHPIYRYKYLDGFNYEKKKAKYLEEFERKPELNIGFKVMGYSVLDIDYRNNGDKTLQGLLTEYEIEMNHVLTVRGGNGLHYYADNKNLKNTAGTIGDGLDVRSEFGFIVAAGSTHYSGKVYEWHEIGEVTTIPEDWVTVSDYEETKLKIQDNSQNNLTTSKRLKDIVLPQQLTSDYVINEGERELTLFKFGCRERGRGKNSEEIYDFLISIRDTFCKDENEPITDLEIRDIANSAASYPTNKEKRLNSSRYKNN
jgi:predicted transcriptional regulator